MVQGWICPEHHPSLCIANREPAFSFSLTGPKIRKPARGGGPVSRAVRRKGCSASANRLGGGHLVAVVQCRATRGKPLNPDEFNLSYPWVIHQAEVIDTFDLLNRLKGSLLLWN